MLTNHLATILALVSSVFIPLARSLITKATTSKDVKNLVTAALATAAGFLSEWQAAGSAHWDWKPALGTSIVSLLIAILSEFGLWTAESKINAALLNFPVQYKTPHPATGQEAA